MYLNLRKLIILISWLSTDYKYRSLGKS